MRIAFDAKRYFHNATGLGRYSRELIDGMRMLHPEHECYLCSPAPSSHDPSLHVIQPRSDQKLYARYWRSFGVLRQLRKNKIELFHGLSGELPYGLRLARIRSVVTVHDLIFLRYPQMYQRADRFIYERKINYAVSHADAVIATSQQTADDISFFYAVPPERMHVVYQSVTMPQPTPQDDQHIRTKHAFPANYFLYVGAIEERKNLLGILEAMRMSHQDFNLLVIGKPRKKYFRQCMDFIEQHDLKPRIQFFTDVPRNELATFYKHAKALVYPSYFEGFGIPIIEAQQCGTAVITSSGGCFGETAGEAALFVDAGDAGTIGNAMNKLMRDERLRQQLIRQGHVNAQRFTREKFIAGISMVYDSVSS